MPKDSVLERSISILLCLKDDCFEFAFDTREVPSSVKTLLNLANQLGNKQDVEDSELQVLLEPIIATSIFFGLPQDIVDESIWPKIVLGDPVDVVKQIAPLRLVCKVWKTHIDSTPAWESHVNFRMDCDIELDYDLPAYDFDGLPYDYYPSDYNSNYQRLWSQFSNMLQPSDSHLDMFTFSDL